MFGEVNVITRKGAALDGGEFSASWHWPQATRRARVSWGKRLDSELELMVSAAILRSDGAWTAPRASGTRAQSVGRHPDVGRPRLGLPRHLPAWPLSLPASPRHPPVLPRPG